MAVFHRIVRSHRAASAMDGEGARRVGGRWNPPGIPVVYMSVSRGLAALEILVHAGRDVIQLDWSVISAEVPEDWIEKTEVGNLPRGWDALLSSQASREFGAEWVRAGRRLAILLPSAIIPEEQVLMVNVRHPDFPKLEITPPRKFRFDHRLG
jgi:RES domain-containing protein